MCIFFKIKFANFFFKRGGGEERENAILWERVGSGYIFSFVYDKLTYVN